MSGRKSASRARLQEAAYALFAERGFAGTTVTAIAERAQVTERTFYRHFADKREVLFANEDALTQRMVDAVRGVDDDATAWRAAMAGLDALAAELQPRHAELRRRSPVLAAYPELREREQLKLATWTAALDAALVDRGVAIDQARLVAGVGIAVLDAAARRWLAAEEDGDLVELVRATARDATMLS